MSLKTFLELAEVKDGFRQAFKLPKLSSPRKLLAPPLSTRYSLVGTAFDYLLRFELQRLNNKAIVQPWIAEQGVWAIDRQSLGSASYDIDERSHSFVRNPISDRAHEMLKQAQVQTEKLLSSGKVSSALLTSTIHLAQLDVAYRVGYIDENLGIAFPEDIQDLNNLLEIVPRNLFLAKKLCLLNPTFGKASTLVAGADADLLIDDMLVDIKTTKNFKMERDNFNQLLGYVVLNEIDAIGGIKPRPRIARVAIYFARHAHLESYEIQELIEKEKLQDFVKWFVEIAKQKSGKPGKKHSNQTKKKAPR